MDINFGGMNTQCGFEEMNSQCGFRGVDTQVFIWRSGHKCAFEYDIKCIILCMVIMLDHPIYTIYTTVLCDTTGTL